LIILGLNAFGKNPSACIVRDGVLEAFCHEERLTRLKGSHGMFPSYAVSWCLRSQDLRLQDVDRIAFAWDCTKYPVKMLLRLIRERLGLFLKRMPAGGESGGMKTDYAGIWQYLNSYSPSVISHGIRDNLHEFGHRGDIPAIDFVPHHIAHACQAYYQSPFDDAVMLVVDGSGEENTVSAFEMRDGKMRKVFGYDVPCSLGWFYGGFTSYLGFRANRDEGKLMGLAAYGESAKDRNPWPERLDRIILVTPDGFEMDPLFFKLGGNNWHPRFSDHLVNFITSFDPDLRPVSIGEMVSLPDGSMKSRYLLDGYVDLAYAVQTRLEEIMIRLTRRLVSETNIKNICLSGGVCMNCKVNGRIAEECGLDGFFVHPASSDDGSAAGAAFYVASQNGDNPKHPLDHVMLGPSYGNEQVETALKDAGADFSMPDDIAFDVAGLLAQGKIVGWFRDGAEMGARALGARSIIANPVNPNISRAVNVKVKRREYWRPFCPSAVSESRSAYFDLSAKLPFMIVSSRATDQLAKEAPSVVHVDGTVRPQTVDEKIQPVWHHLLKRTESHTGHPLVLNTSFNVRGEPIVCAPHDAIRDFFSTGLDALAIEDFLLVKKN
jgi:carbamoyltransferase